VGYLKKKLKKVSVSGKKISAPIPIPKLDLGYGSQYQNLVLVVHYHFQSSIFSGCKPTKYDDWKWSTDKGALF
jgi:hypothetical protein